MIDSVITFDIFRKIPAFRSLNESEFHQLVDVALQKAYKPGDKVIVQGQSSQNLWIVLDGVCEVIKDSHHDGSLVLAQLEPFGMFGEMSFFSPAPHSANVVAKTAVKLLTISRPDYDDMIRDGVSAAYKLAYNALESVATRLRRMDEWIAELASHNGATSEEHKEMHPEWREFRKKMLDKWNL